MVQPHGTVSASAPPFTYILEYMGESITIQTVWPTHFKLLNLCFIASSALQQEDLPPNHVFRPTCAPSWLGRVVKLLLENEGNDDFRSNVPDVEPGLRPIQPVDVLGKEFSSDEAADVFYCEYAKSMGFGVRRHNKRWNTKGELTGRKWVCSREGYRPRKFIERDDIKREAKPLTRTGCKAAFKIKRKDQNNTWICTQFNAMHNHILTPPQHVHYIRSHQKVSIADLAVASSLRKVGVKPSQIHEYMVQRSGGYNNVGYMRKDMQNRLDSEFKKHLTELDAETCLSYLEAKKSDDPAFFFSYTISEDKRLGDLFWCDGGLHADYAMFGDVVAFDATYQTNAYHKPFVVLLGINHHRRTIVFGFALLLDET